MNGDQRGRLAALAGDELDDDQLDRLALVLSVVEHDEHAPTAVRDRQSAIDAHLADSLVGMQFAEIRSARAIADLGSGAGFPGIVLAVALPHAAVRLVESQHRKCDFLQRLCERAKVANAEVVCARAEDWQAGREASDAVVARALAPQPVVLEYAAPLLRLGGALLDWRGRRSERDERAASAACAALGMRLSEIRRVLPFAGARERHVHVFCKEEQTPRRFPRRAGMARKRPLGA
jgi:16S rRNA (guanine527-N7)-methyltransferase